jgi:ATP-dependent DNA helicase DinG
LIITTDDPPIAKWFYPKIAPDQGESDLVGIMQDYKVCASYIEAGDMLDDLLWQQVEHSVILCSATVKSMGNFKRFIDSTGIDPKTQQIDLPSPFPYWKSQLFIPNMKYNPKSSIQHIKESSEQIRAALSTTTKGVMVLFTSMYAMREVFEKLPINIQSHIIMQGEQSKSVILAKHKKMIDKKSRSIIFGVDSFAEGVDLMGDYLTLLIIHKLPFAVPSNPIEKTRSEWLESKNKKPFFEVSLPTASIKLTQMVGRLIRDEDDQGIVIILDTRLKTKRYGQEMLRNLPRFKIVNNIQEV